MRRILLIGANGFIGSHLAEYMNLHHEVHLTLVSRMISDHLLKLKERKNVTVIQGDYQDLLFIEPILRTVDIVYHLASSSFPSSSWNNPQQDVEKNLKPTIDLFSACTYTGVKKIVFISSAGTIYGNNQGLLNEETPAMPFSPYGIVKYAIENFLEYYRLKSGINYDIYRLSNVYGPGQNKVGFGVINTWLRNAKEDAIIKVYGDGTASKDYIYIDDAVRLMSHSVVSDEDTSFLFNICSSETHSLNDIIRVIENILDKPLNVEYIDRAKSDNAIVRLDNKKILQNFDLKTFISLEEGVLLTWDSLG